MGKERSLELFMSGYNCAQSVVAGYADELETEEKLLLSLSACFGAGLSATRGICGAITGGLMVLGLHRGWIQSTQKKLAYDEGRALIEGFEEEFGCTDCAQLLAVSKARFSTTPQERTAEYYGARPCAGLVAFTCDWLNSRL